MDWFLEHYPFFLAAALFWLIGHFMETSVFTRARAHKNRGGGWKAKLTSGFWWWMRESMELHPILAGVVLGLIWRNPENMDPAPSWQFDVGYFIGAGIVSLAGWLVLTKLAQKAGINLSGLRLPGESLPPDAQRDAAAGVNVPKPPKVPSERD